MAAAVSLQLWVHTKRWRRVCTVCETAAKEAGKVSCGPRAEPGFLEGFHAELVQPRVSLEFLALDVACGIAMRWRCRAFSTAGALQFPLPNLDKRSPHSLPLLSNAASVLLGFLLRDKSVVVNVARSHRSRVGVRGRSFF